MKQCRQCSSEIPDGRNVFCKPCAAHRRRESNVKSSAKQALQRKQPLPYNELLSQHHAMYKEATAILASMSHRIDRTRILANTWAGLAILSVLGHLLNLIY